MTTAAAGKPAAPPLGLVVMNLGGPSSLDDVEPFLERLFGDPDVIQLGWLGFLQPLLARMIAKRRGPLSRAAYAQIGGRSPIREETTAQAKAVADRLVGVVRSELSLLAAGPRLQTGRSGVPGAQAAGSSPPGAGAGRTVSLVVSRCAGAGRCRRRRGSRRPPCPPR